MSSSGDAQACRHNMCSRTYRDDDNEVLRKITIFPARYKDIRPIILAPEELVYK